MISLNIIADFTVSLIAIMNSVTQGSISGISYIDAINFKPQNAVPRGEDPCKPLYWYPRPIPDYCFYPAISIKPPKIPPSPPPAPPSLPIFPPVPPPPPIIPPFPPPVIQMPPQQMPFGVPMMSFPTPMFPVQSPVVPMPSPVMQIPSPFMSMPPPISPYPIVSMPGFPRQQTYGYIPPIPGIVTNDGGINILPFSDVYSDMLEKQKQKLLRKRLRKVLDEYNSDY